MPGNLAGASYHLPEIREHFECPQKTAHSDGEEVHHGLHGFHGLHGWHGWFAEGDRSIREIREIRVIRVIRGSPSVKSPEFRWDIKLSVSKDGLSSNEYKEPSPVCDLRIVNPGAIILLP